MPNVCGGSGRWVDVLCWVMWYFAKCELSGGASCARSGVGSGNEVT